MSLFGFLESILGTSPTLTNLENKILSIETKYTLLGTKYTQLKQQFSATSSQLATLQQQYSQLQSQNTQMAAQIKSLNSQVATLNSQISQLDLQVNQYETAIASYKSTIAGLKAQLSTDASQIGTYQSQINGLNTEVSALQAQITTDNGTISTLNSTITSLKSQITSLQNQLVQSFSASPTVSSTSGNAPLSVNFLSKISASNLPSGVTPAVTWNFGDGETSTDLNPSHTYQAGTFTPSLVVTVESYVKTFTLPSITSIATGNIQAAPSGTTTDKHAPVSVSFANGLSQAQILGVTDSPDVTYAWDFGDGNSSSDANPTHTYTNTQNSDQYYTPTVRIYAKSGNYSFNRLFTLLQQDIPPMWPHTITITGPTSVSVCSSSKTETYTANLQDDSGRNIPNARIEVDATNPIGQKSQIGIGQTDSNGNLQWDYTWGWDPAEPKLTWSFKCIALRNPTVTQDYGVSAGCY